MPSTHQHLQSTSKAVAMDAYRFDPVNPLRLTKRAGVASRKAKTHGYSDDGHGHGSDNDNDNDSAVEEQGFQARSRYANKRKKVEVLAEVYGSDSSDEDTDAEEAGTEGHPPSTTHAHGTGAGAGAGAGADGVDDDDDDDNDMFASDGDTVEKESSSHREEGSGLKQKLHVELMDMETFNTENLGKAPSASTEEHDDNVRIEAFDLEEETKVGVFDKDGNYIKMRGTAEDEAQSQDQWMDDYTSSDAIRQAQLAKQKREATREEQRLKNRESKRAYTPEEALVRLSFLVDTGETVLGTLGRFNKYRSEYVNQQKRARKDGSSVPSGLDSKLKYTATAIALATELVEILEQKGIADVYDLTRERIHALIAEESLSHSGGVDNYQAKVWSFKWLHSAGSINEFYTNYEMQYWKQTYFNDGVVVKYKDDHDDEENWLHVRCVGFM